MDIEVFQIIKRNRYTQKETKQKIKKQRPHGKKKQYKQKD